MPAAFRGLFEPHRYKAFHGGRGSAKSHSFATALVILAAQKPLRIVCAREIQNSLRDSVKQLVEDKIATLGLSARFRCLDKMTRGVNGSQFTYIGLWRNPDAIKSLEGADIFWGEEASAFSERSLKIVRPTMRKPGSELWFSWNPEFEHDPVDLFFRGRMPPPQALICKVSWRDNPWFAGTPLQAEMEFDYEADPARAEHVWGGGYVTAVDGAYYAAPLAEARAGGRIGRVAADPLLAMRAFWDLGVSDSTAIWVAQFAGREIRVIDYCEGQGQPLGFYADWLRGRGYGAAECVLPHDGARRDSVSALKYEDHLREAGFRVRTIANQGRGAAMKRIEAARRLFPSIWFNEEDCRDGLKSLAAYLDRLPRQPVPTTCFGHTGPEVKVGRHYSNRQCSVLLEGDLSREAVGVYRCGPPALAARPLVWAALTDLAHNIGVAGVCRSSAMRRFQTGRWREGCGRIALFDKAGGRVLPGLVRRRAREVALCLKGVEG